MTVESSLIERGSLRTFRVTRVWAASRIEALHITQRRLGDASLEGPPQAHRGLRSTRRGGHGFGSRAAAPGVRGAPARCEKRTDVHWLILAYCDRFYIFKEWFEL